jgi:lysophospholipase L1-like esterase
MIYIQTAEGLSQISSSLTKEKIIAALGYTPADNVTFYEDESGVLAITDESGYVIAKIGETGLETTTISANAVVLNGEDLNEKLKSLENIDLTGYATETYVDEAIAAIEIPEPDLKDYALATDVQADKAITDAHMANTDIHVTAADKLRWENRSSFSGDYKDLINAPSLSNDNEEEFVIADGDGNVIMKIDSNGLNVTDLYINGHSIASKNHLTGKTVSIIGDSISTYSGFIPNGYSAAYPGGDVTSVYQTWWKQLIDNNDMILGTNASYSGSTVQSDGPGIPACSDDRIAAVGSNGTPDLIIIYIGVNDSKIEDLATIGEINPLIDMPFTSETPAKYDTTTFIGAYQAMLTKLMLAYPEARIACCGLLWNN